MLVRHGQSEWNLKNLFTGWRDAGPDRAGRRGGASAAGRQAEGAAASIRHRLHLGADARAEDLPASSSTNVGQTGLETIRDQALNERDYGDLSGLNKDDARAKWGEEQVHVWRRSYDVPPPGGESLKDTGARVWPYYLHDILPHVLRGETVLVAAHGNSLRALIMALDGLTRRGDRQAGTRHRRADRLPAQRRFHRRVQGSAGWQ